MATLQIKDYKGRRTSLELEAGKRYSIGRSDQNEIVLEDPSLSRRHAEAYDQEGKWFIRDCGSRNGTLVGGRALQGPSQFQPGVQVVLGACSLTMALPAAAGAGAPGAVIFADRPLEASGTMMLSPDDLIRVPAPTASDAEGFNEQLQKIRKRLEIVERANLELLAHESMDVMLHKILDLVFEALDPERAAIVQRDAEGELVCQAFRGDSQQEMSVSRTIADTVLDQRVSVMTSDAQTDERFADGASIVAQGIQAVMAAPLWNKQKVIGLIYADSRLASVLFGDDDLRLLTMLANIAAIQIENATLFSEQLEKQRFEREAKAAADIQQRLLPRSQPEIPGYLFAGHNEACYECGGDYYDCLSLGEGRAGIVLADVAGKGMGAAMLMAVIQATMQARAVTDVEPKELIDQLGSAISRSAPSNRYATLFFMDLDHTTHRVRYVNAGHAPPPLFVRATGEATDLVAGGTPLGLFPDVDYPISELEMGVGDFIFACSDGVTDLEDADEEMFGEERLEKLLVSLAGRPLDDIRATLDKELQGFAGDTQRPDDLTYVILQRAG